MALPCNLQIYLPRFIKFKPVENDELGGVHQGDGNTQLPLVNQFNVLVVEDNRSAREVAAARLCSMGFSVIEADSGPAAISILESTRQVDLLFCDLVLGGDMSGQEVAHWVYTNKPKCKILLTSGFTDKHVVELKANTPRWRVLQKPYKFDTLKKSIETLINQ